jgi:hypothetical protein
MLEAGEVGREIPDIASRGSDVEGEMEESSIGQADTGKLGFGGEPRLVAEERDSLTALTEGGGVRSSACPQRSDVTGIAEAPTAARLPSGLFLGVEEPGVDGNGRRGAAPMRWACNAGSGTVRLAGERGAPCGVQGPRRVSRSRFGLRGREVELGTEAETLLVLSGKGRKVAERHQFFKLGRGQRRGETYAVRRDALHRELLRVVQTVRGGAGSEVSVGNGGEDLLLGFGKVVVRPCLRGGPARCDNQRGQREVVPVRQ